MVDNRQTETGAFFNSVWGKILSILGVITMLGGVAAEGVSFYRSWQDSLIASNNIQASKAEQCAKRRRYVIDYVSMGEWDKANAEIDKDCDPLYAQHQAEIQERAAVCDEKFKTVVKAIETIDFNDKDPNATIRTAIENHKGECTITDAQRAAAKAASERRNEKVTRLQNAISSLIRPTPSPTSSAPTLHGPAEIAT